MIEQLPCWGVYRVLASGAHEYVSRSATTNEKLAAEIASDLSFGRVIRPDGSVLDVPPHPHVYKLIEPAQSAASHMGVHKRTPDCTVSCIHPVTVNVAGHEYPVPRGWDHIPADDDDVTITLTRAELNALIKACGVAHDEDQFDDAIERAAWEKLLRIEQF